MSPFGRDDELSLNNGKSARDEYKLNDNIKSVRSCKGQNKEGGEIENLFYQSLNPPHRGLNLTQHHPKLTCNCSNQCPQEF